MPAITGLKASCGRNTIDTDVRQENGDTHATHLPTCLFRSKEVIVSLDSVLVRPHLDAVSSSVIGKTEMGNQNIE